MNCVSKKKIALLLTFAGMAVGSAQAASVDGVANATVIAPVAITHDAGAALNFGAFTNEAAGTVTIATDGNRTATGVVVVAGGTTSADSFTVTSTSGYQVNIALPALSIDVANLGNTMPVSNFKAALSTAPSSVITNFTSTGSDVIKVGADIAVTAGQATGSYTGTYPVQVNYN